MNASLSVTVDLKEKNIDVQGAEFYAVVNAYIAKINSLNGVERGIMNSTFSLASKYEVTGSAEDKKALDEAFLSVVSEIDEPLKALLIGEGSREEKIEALHEYAVTLGCQRDYLETVSRCRQFTTLNDKLEHEKETYFENYETFKSLMQIKNDEKALEQMILMRAGAVKTPIDEIKPKMLANIEEIEQNFLKMQDKFVGSVVSFLVDDACRIEKHKLDEQIAAEA